MLSLLLKIQNKNKPLKKFFFINTFISAEKLKREGKYNEYKCSPQWNCSKSALKNENKWKAIVWNYFATCHGIGPADYIGGVLVRSVRSMVIGHAQRGHRLQPNL